MTATRAHPPGHTRRVERGEGGESVEPVEPIERRSGDGFTVAPTGVRMGESGRRPIESAAAWRSGELDDRWCIELSVRQRATIVDATRRAVEAGYTAATLSAVTFAPGDLAGDIAAWSRELAEGRGFVLLRGFPVDEMSLAEIEVAYVGLGSHLGRPVGQNAAGDRLTHVIDERLPASAGQVRLYRTRQRQDFHSDGADIIGLLCLQTAKRGGESRIVSSAAIYNEMLATAPDLLDALHEPLCWDRQGDHASGERPWFRLAPIDEIDEAPRIFYIGWYLRDAQRHADADRLTPRHLAAMELLERLANDPGFHLSMDFARGDVQLLNNARILHSREAYEDHPEPERRRHLLRLWLAAHRFASVEPGLRAGLGSR